MRLMSIRSMRPLLLCFLPSILSGVAFAEERRITNAAHVVFLIGEREYDTRRTLPAFAADELISRGLRCTFVHADPDDPNQFPGIAAVADADLVFVSVRRRTPPIPQLAFLRQHLAAGKPLVGIRTASHAWDAPPPPGHDRWERFDREVFGMHYQRHYGNKPPEDPPSLIRVASAATDHPILKGVRRDEFPVTSHLYRNRDPGAQTTTLMTGWVPDRGEREPVAWTNAFNGARVFYTSLGDPEDLRRQAVRLLLVNAVYWALGEPSPGTLLSAAVPDAIELSLRRRDVLTGEVQMTKERVDPVRVGIVAIDMWNWHWCKTSAARVGALVPRMNRVFEAARHLGMQVFLCPTDAVEAYVGTPQREIVFAMPRHAMPDPVDVNCPRPRDGGGCTCGVERCKGNYGWDAMHPDLIIGSRDLMPNDPEVLYSICQQRGITHLIYTGVHTQVCVLNKSVGVRRMKAIGLECILARDLTDAHGVYQPDEGFTPDDLTAEVIEHFEKHLVATVDLGDEMRNAGFWDDSVRIDPVRFAPWGKRERPHLFEKEVVVTLTDPLHEGAEIRYTLDDSDPHDDSQLYEQPLQLSASQTVRAASFIGDRQLNDVSEGHFVRLGSSPPAPDIHLSEIEPLRVAGPGHSPSATRHRFSGLSNPPQKDRSNRKAALRMRGQTYARGMGVHAPNQLLYRVEPHYERFVALAGIDEEILEYNNASNLGRFPSVIFRVYIDGKLRAESPVMKISEEPWRFDVSIRKGSRQISLVATDAGDGNKLDLANWANAGFVIRKAAAGR